ncbi:MAG: sulfotransferase [Pseudomonadota bacterium]|nr:sulfotransferase [Pseudomonadota bacterium]
MKRLLARLRAARARRETDVIGRYRRRYPKLRGTVFIVTYGRSGSTLLQALLNTAPGVHLGGETFDTLGALHDATARATRAHTRWGDTPRSADHPWHGAQNIDERGLERDLAFAYVTRVVNPPLDAMWVGTKEMRYPQRVEVLPQMVEMILRAFPNPIIVFNSRDAGDVAQSRWWAERPEDEVRDLIARMDATFAEIARTHPDRCFHLHHEDTTSNPDSLRPVFDAMGAEFDVAAIARVLSNRLTH